jgi:hypothetical protein
MVVVDGRVDREKLFELLAFEAEQEALDFKATLDLADPKHQVEHVKDLLAMMSLPAGGYIIVGVDNNGKPAIDQQPIDPKQFDSAVLQQKVSAYVDGRLSIVAAVHELQSEVGTREVALIFAGPPPGLLPLVVTKQGQYERNGGRKPEVVFRPGQVVVRDGTTTTRLAEHFWPRLLERYTERVKDDARRDVDALVRRIVEMLDDQRSAASGMGAEPSLAIDLGMDLETFAIAADALIEAGSLPRLTRFLLRADDALRAVAASGNLASANGLLDRLFALGESALLYGTSEQFDRVIDALARYYCAIPTLPDAVTNETPSERGRASAMFEVLSRLYVIGSLAVRQSRWEQLRSLVLRPYEVNETYSYASWIRHALTMSARAGVLRSKENDVEGAPVISRALQLMMESPELRPDVRTIDPRTRARLYDSLCEFDILWCVVAQTATDRPDAMDFYPSSSEIDQVHANGAFTLIAKDRAARHLLLPAKSDQEIGTALLYVWARAYRQSWQHGGWWDRLPAGVYQWAKDAGAVEPDLNG